MLNIKYTLKFSLYYKQLFLRIIHYKRNKKPNMEPENPVIPKIEE